MRIGEFGAAKRELSDEKDDFVFCGEAFIVQQPVPPVLAIQLGASMSGTVDETEGFAAMWEALRISLTIPEHHRLAATDEYEDADENRNITVPEDDALFRKFYHLAIKNAVDLNDLMKLVMGLFEAQTGRPTRRASASSDGPPTILRSSNTSSHLRSVDSLIRGDSVEVTEGNPNLIEMADGTVVEFVPAELTG